MKRILSIALLGFAATAALPAAVVHLNFFPSPILEGDTFTMAVTVTDVFGAFPGDGLTGFGFNPVISDPSKVTFLGATVGGLFDDFSASVGGNPQVAGLVSLPFIFLGAADITEPLTLATLTFQAIGSGYVDVGVASHFSTSPNDGLQFLAGVEDLNATASVDIVPEPAVAWLLAPGLGALLLLRRRRQA
jgi:hypothetical protein